MTYRNHTRNDETGNCSALALAGRMFRVCLDYYWPRRMTSSITLDVEITTNLALAVRCIQLNTCSIAPALQLSMKYCLFFTYEESE